MSAALNDISNTSGSCEIDPMEVDDAPDDSWQSQQGPHWEGLAAPMEGVIYSSEAESMTDGPSNDTSVYHTPPTAIAGYSEELVARQRTQGSVEWSPLGEHDGDFSNHVHANEYSGCFMRGSPGPNGPSYPLVQATYSNVQISGTSLVGLGVDDAGMMFLAGSPRPLRVAGVSGDRRHPRATYGSRGTSLAQGWRMRTPRSRSGCDALASSHLGSTSSSNAMMPATARTPSCQFESPQSAFGEAQRGSFTYGQTTSQATPESDGPYVVQTAQEPNIALCPALPMAEDDKQSYMPEADTDKRFVMFNMSLRGSDQGVGCFGDKPYGRPEHGVVAAQLPDGRTFMTQDPEARAAMQSQ